MLYSGGIGGSQERDTSDVIINNDDNDDNDDNDKITNNTVIRRKIGREFSILRNVSRKN